MKNLNQILHPEQSIALSRHILYSMNKMIETSLEQLSHPYLEISLDTRPHLPYQQKARYVY